MSSSGATSSALVAAKLTVGASSGVPVESLGEDGWLLKRFVCSGEHLLPDAAENAQQKWLIRATFYKQYLEEFVLRFARRDDLASQAASSTEVVKCTDEPGQSASSTSLISCSGDSAQASDIAASFGKIFTKEKPLTDANVRSMEAKYASSDGDPLSLRDMIFSSIKELTSPRLKSSDRQGTGEAMSDEVKAMLKLNLQGRLRDVLLKALRGLRSSGQGTKMLDECVEKVRVMLTKFEQRSSDLSDAYASGQWKALSDLVDDINEESATHKREGKSTETLIDEVLKRLGGRATVQQVLKYIEANPDIVKECAGVKLNMQDAVGSTSGCKKWQITVGTRLSDSYTFEYDAETRERYYLAQKLPEDAQGKHGKKNRAEFRAANPKPQKILKRPARSKPTLHAA